jgi:galactan 5-O-arabinofuranosyltransferase
MYCLMILAVLGLMALVQRGTGWVNRVVPAKDASVGVIPRRVLGQLSAGMVCAIALFATMGASWSINRYMPESSPSSMGIDAYRAHEIKKPNGLCPKFSPVKDCANPIVKDWAPTADDGYIWCAGISADDWQAVCGRPAPWVTDTKK